MNAKQYVDHFVKVMEENDLQDVMLVSHSMGGIWAQLLLQEVPPCRGYPVPMGTSSPGCPA